ncbi:hypothetical protein Cgig2_003614 [Carnegiea gigantea]|uniref:Uncharacterized protein n=1 Tax=Carnegiea gigantea TaxID=171969 RepID=A0A9Q1GMW4_9CARY|nr:hypothetical protein Cgig2_003614 [Carnegiea gigantea]
MQPRRSPSVQSITEEAEKSTSKPVLQNIPEESLEKTKRHRHGHEDETESKDDFLMKRIKKIKEASNLAQSSSKKKKKNICLELKLEKKGSVKKSPSPAKPGQLLVKSPNKQANNNIGILDPKHVQEPAETDTKYKKTFQTRMSLAGFVAMQQAIWDTVFGGFLELQVTKLPEALCTWFVDNIDPYLVILYVTSDKKIEITHRYASHISTPNWWKED